METAVDSNGSSDCVSVSAMVGFGADNGMASDDTGATSENVTSASKGTSSFVFAS